MFGQDDNNQQQQPAPTQPQDPSVLNAAMPDPIDPNPPAGFNILADQSAPSQNYLQDLSAPELPASGTPDQPETALPTPDAPTNDNSSTTVPAGNDLVDIKQQALQHLSPLVGQLDQTPEEKFRTTMMLIQASDNRELVKEAFEAAQAISDDKARAQALLDVINEINYFTQHES